MKLFIAVCMLTFVFYNLGAQTKTLNLSKEKGAITRINHPFPLSEKALTFFDQEIDFSKFDKPTYIRVGFIGCHPCSFEMPAFIQLSKEYPGVDFIYITFDDPKDIMEHYDSINYQQTNLYFVQLSRDKIEDNRLVLGYPSNWYVLKGNVVNAFTHGGRTSELELSYSKFKNAVEAIR